MANCYNYNNHLNWMWRLHCLILKCRCCGLGGRHMGVVHKIHNPKYISKGFFNEKKKHIHHLTHSSVVLEAPQVIEKVRSEAHVWNYWVSPHILDGNSPHISKRNSSHISDRNSARISCKVCFHGHTTIVVQDNCRCNKRGHPKKSAEGTHIFHMVESSTPFHILSGSFSTQKCR